ncbi:hypothetical protein Peur_050670 [Populus x canadensis]
MEAALSDEQRLLLQQEPGELGSLAGSNMPELNQVISLQDLAPSTLVDGAPSDVSQDVPDSTRQGSPSFNSLSMQDDQSPKGGDHQPQIFDGNIDLSFLENEEGNVTGGISDSSVAEAPNSQLLDFEPSSFGTPLMEQQGHLEPESSDEPYLNRANSGQSILQSAYSTFDSINAAQTRSSSVNPPLPIPTQMGMIPTNEMVPPFSMGNGTPTQFNSQSQEDTFQSELFLPPPVLPFNQSSISFNDQVGQNNVINNSIQQTTQFPASYPQNMIVYCQQTTMGNLEGTPSWINQYELLPNHNTPPGPLTPSRYQPNQLIAANFFDSQCNNPMLPGSSMPSRHQYLTNYQLRLSDQVPGMLSGPQPPMNRRPQQRPYLFNQVQITPNVFDPQGSTMLPDSCLNLIRSPQFPSHNLQVSGEHDTEWPPSHKVQESMNASSLGSRVAKNDIYDPLFEGIGLQIDPHLRMLALM